MEEVHPLKTKAIASNKLKNDKLDANILAKLLRGDLLVNTKDHFAGILELSF